MEFSDFSDICELAIDGSGTGIWDRNVVTGEIRYSASWFGILGYAEGQPPNPIEISYTRVHPEDLGYVKAAIDAHFRGETETYEAEHRIRCKDGTYKWVLSRGKVIRRDEAGRPLRMVGTTTDVTATRMLATQLQKEHAEAVKSSQQLMETAKQLTQRTEELAAAHRLARVGSWRWDLRKRSLWFSPETWATVGLPPSNDPVSYERVRAIIHPDDYLPVMDCYYGAVKSKTPTTLECRIVWPDGSIRNVVTHAEPIFEADDVVVQVRGTTQDITSYRQIEAALRNSEDHYRNMVELHPQIPWTSSPDGTILELGPRFSKITGIPNNKLLPYGWLNAVHFGDKARVVAEWNKSLASGERLDIEYRLHLKDGVFGWFRARAAARFDEAGKIIRWYGTLEDVTDRYVAEAARRESESLAFRVLEATSDAVIVFDKEARVKYANARAIEQIGGGEKLVNLTSEQIFKRKNGRIIREAIKRAIGSLRTSNFEVFWEPRKIWFEISVYSSARDVSVFMRDISDRKLAQERLNYAACYDFLTGALNRREFFGRLSECLAKQTARERVALFCMDINYFKDVNDAYGHPVGDRLLKLIVSRLQSLLRANDLVARSGGDEFMIAQIGVRDQLDAETVAQRIVTEMQKPFMIDSSSICISVSIGATISQTELDEPDTVYKQADMALYEAKGTAFSRYRFFQPAMAATFNVIYGLRLDLASALENNEIFLVYQPIIRVADRSIVGVEALARWNHPLRGAVSPTEFIPVAEDSGLISEIGSWVLQRACAAATRWPSELKISVNVSPRQFELSNIYHVVLDALESSRLDASRLKLEVTESVFMSRSSSNLKILNELRELGINLVLDDFGKGYSSLSYLDMFRFDFVKIDQSFISRVGRPGETQPILEAIMGMTAALGLPVTVEGVETDIQFNYIRRLGCEFAQGHLFGKPVIERELERQLARTFERQADLDLTIK